MPRAPSRALQIACGLIAVLGIAPWVRAFAATVLQAIESERPLTMSVAAWLVLLVPVWVIWFATLAWRQRNASIMPAVLMALPGAVLVVLVVAMPRLHLGPGLGFMP